MASFRIQGGIPLSGSVRVGGAKNASFKLMIASLLASSQSRLLNLSRISDVEVVSHIIEYLGGSVRRAGERSLFIDPSALHNHVVKAEHGDQGRFSTMFIPVLLHRFGQAVVPAPGGDKIGKRPLDRHFAGLEAMGAHIETQEGHYVAHTEGLHGATYRFPKSTHTGTETLIMAAVLATGRTVLENAAEEPEIDDLIEFLNNMGARITRPETRVIQIEGVPELHGAIHKVMSDQNEAVSYACAALATKGDIIVENAVSDHLEAFLVTLDQMHAGYELGNYGIRFFYRAPLQAVNVVTEIHPGFKTDWQPLLATVLTQCEGVSTLHETIHPNRFQYVPPLQEMGAQIEFYNPEFDAAAYGFDPENDRPEYNHAIKVTGPTPLKAGEFTVVDLRHGATLVCAALAAQGTSLIHQIEHIDRGYEDLEERLRSMGAQIDRLA